LRAFGRSKQTKIVTPNYDCKFPHAFKNGKWHLLQPITFDYRDPAYIQDKATKWLGRESVLREADEFGHIYMLLGAPPYYEHKDAYKKEKSILAKMSVDHRIVEEDEAEDFAQYLQEYMQEHGVTR